MNFVSLLLLAIGLSMDAFAVAVCKGLATRDLKWKHMVIVGLWFGAFQALMPTLGYFLGTVFERYITAVDHWFAFILLGLIGCNMIREACSRDCCDDEVDASFAFKPMLLMAVATSVDALAAGIPLPSLNVNIVMAASFIGICTFTLSAIGVKVGNLFGKRFKKAAELTGGIILVLLGTQILLEHLGILVF